MGPFGTCWAGAQVHRPPIKSATVFLVFTLHPFNPHKLPPLLYSPLRIPWLRKPGEIVEDSSWLK